ncbi:MAG: class I SAM-dependent methyltransferase [Myxococcota bacterium]
MSEPRPFDRAHAAHYDRQFAALQPLKDALHLCVDVAFAPLPADARILVVGAGTGAELLALAERHPGWTFTGVDPAQAMLDVCAERLAAAGLDARVTLHCGTVDTLPPSAPFHAATSLLVSQFLLDEAERTGFFRAIGARLGDGGLLASADLVYDAALPSAAADQQLWRQALVLAGHTAEAADANVANWNQRVAVLPAARIEAILEGAGFPAPARMFQGLRIVGWTARKA